MSDVVSDIKRAKAASIELSVLSTEVKDRALGAMAQALDSSREQILEANARDRPTPGTWRPRRRCSTAARYPGRCTRG